MESRHLGGSGPVAVPVLLVDLYELTMARSYLRHGVTGTATFSLFVRRLPPDRGFLVAAGLQEALDDLEDWCLDGAALDDVARVSGLDRASLGVLDGVRFTGDVWAVPEGRAVLPDEPLLEVTAPVVEAQLVETLLLNRLDVATVLTSKAVRSRLAAGGSRVIDFSARRTHGHHAALQAARAGGLVGFAGTSNVEAAVRYGLRAVGTMAHSFVESFGSERAAFEAFAADQPEATVLLVDTYDTIEGTRRAIEVMDRLGLPPTTGIRLDSGDLADLAVRTRAMLDAAGRSEAVIVASGALDEYAVADLRERGAPIDVFAVGTKVGTSADAPYLDSAYKLVEYDGRPVVKTSPGKATMPGRKQVWRRAGVPDVLAGRDEPGPPGAEALLVEVMRGGRRVAPREGLDVARARLEADLVWLPEAARRVHEPEVPGVHVSPVLRAATEAARGAVTFAPGPVDPPGR